MLSAVSSAAVGNAGKMDAAARTAVINFAYVFFIILPLSAFLLSCIFCLKIFISTDLSMLLYIEYVYMRVLYKNDCSYSSSQMLSCQAKS